MASYRVGQRVRVVAHTAGSRFRDYTGCEGRVDRIGSDPDDIRFYGVAFDYWVHLDGTPDDAENGFMHDELAPLTDPRASEFIQDMARFAHLAQKDKVKA